ncbi:MAG: redoxin domain-containing protein, partial [Ardenticatenaceae bacterium]
MKKTPIIYAAMALAAIMGALAVDCGGEELPTPPAAPTFTQPPVSINPTATPLETQPTATPESPQQTGTETNRPAPEIDGITGWINTEPFTLQQLREQGNVVLIDFWTYTCVNCIRTFPYLREWHAKYADKGLAIVGVHAPEFEFEKIKSNVEDAVEEFDIGWRVAQDNDFVTWRAFSNQFWPAKYLIDVEGNIRYTHFGEGAYQETEDRIRAMLEEAGADLSGVSAETAPEPAVDSKAFVADPNFSLTRELYAGYQRNNSALLSGSMPPYVLHREYYEQRDAAIEYSDPGQHRNHFIYLQGLWRNGPENLVHARETENHDDYVAIRFFANSVN